MTVHPMQRWLRSVDPVLRTGRVRKILSTYIEADGPGVTLGTLCDVEARSSDGSVFFLAEVVRVDQDSVTLTPLEEGFSTFVGAWVRARSQAGGEPVGPGFLGRVVDALGRPLDRGEAIRKTQFHPLHGSPIPPLDRSSPTEILETGIRAVDGLLTLGKGQRVGIFAASGVGKTSLMGQIARQVEADVTIICLVGERGREVEAMWNRGLDARARARTTLVAATSDHSAALRVRACHYALALAEYWRAQGRHVLLLLDSVTRLAMAMREIGLAAGEPPTVRAYTPGVFAAIPKLVERAGALKSGGAITAIMTVLSENDEVDDPVCEMMKSLLDGHILLSRDLAEKGHFPAIDVPRSVSRQAENLVRPSHRKTVFQVLEWLSLLEASRTMIDAGLYAAGSNATLDRAISLQAQLTGFLRQGREERSGLNETGGQLARIAEGRG
jgi:flagellum-specific ATP synthase